MEQAGFILKVLVISTAVSALIKYGGPALSVPATPAIVLTFVVLPTLVMVIALFTRYTKGRRQTLQN